MAPRGLTWNPRSERAETRKPEESCFSLSSGFSLLDAHFLDSLSLTRSLPPLARPAVPTAALRALFLRFAYGLLTIAAEDFLEIAGHAIAHVGRQRALEQPACEPGRARVIPKKHTTLL